MSASCKQMARPGWAGGLAGPGLSGPRRPGRPQRMHCGKACPSGRIARFCGS